MAGLFDTFTTAKRGLSVQQNNINVNAHNIANAQTKGYSRQRAVTETTRPFGGMSRFDTCSVGQIGTGAEVTSIQRIRDNFTDYQLRHEYGKLGNYQVQNDFLSEVNDIFGEPSDKGIQNLFSEFYSTFQELAKKPYDSSTRTVAIQKSSSLATALNQAYAALEKKTTNAQDLLQQNVLDVNSWMNQINELNQEIFSVSAVGMAPNDLMDKRDNLLDELSNKFGITVKRDDNNTINLSMDGFPNPADSASGALNNLVNSAPSNTNYTRFSYVKGVGDITANTPTGFKMEVEYYALGNSKSTPETMTVTATTEKELESLKSSFEQNRILVADKDGNALKYDTASSKFVSTTNGETLNASDIKKSIFKIYESDSSVNTVDPKAIKGEIAGNQSVQNMMKGYMDELDKVAKVLAYSVNAIQTGSDGTTPLSTDLSNPAHYLLFVNSDGATSTDDNISAKNITVNQEIINDVFKLNCKNNTTSGDQNGDRAQAIADLNTVKMNISSIDISKLNSRDDFFTGLDMDGDGTKELNFGVTFNGVKVSGNTSGKTIDNYYKDMIGDLGTKAQEAERIVTKQKENTIATLEDQKASVSGVSLDEEMTDLVQFQHAYQANAKMINTIDQLLDVVINQLKA